ncbi:MAG: hypothetical protein GXY36_06285 [Chloroflexi bacterium]|nr:hypothetical protein [Chloroflexota bacterium]
MAEYCPECGAAWEADQTCEDAFHQMLFWEAERPELGEVHHLMVLCYYLQHPHRYSPEGLLYAQRLLADFVEQGLTPQQVRQRSSEALGSDRRDFKITARPDEHGAYPRPVIWTMRAGDVVAAGMASYRESVRRWALSVHTALKARDGGTPD